MFLSRLFKDAARFEFEVVIQETKGFSQSLNGLDEEEKQDVYYASVERGSKRFRTSTVNVDDDGDLLWNQRLSFVCTLYRSSGTSVYQSKTFRVRVKSSKRERRFGRLMRHVAFTKDVNLAVFASKGVRQATLQIPLESERSPRIPEATTVEMHLNIRCRWLNDMCTDIDGYSDCHSSGFDSRRSSVQVSEVSLSRDRQVSISHELPQPQHPIVDDYDKPIEIVGSSHSAIVPSVSPRSPPRNEGGVEAERVHTREISFIPFSSLQNVHRYAEGNFGITYRADWRCSVLISDNEDDDAATKPVVIKVPKHCPGKDEWSELFSYIDLPAHDNVLGYLGIVRDFPELPFENGNAFCVVTAFQPFTLHNYVACNQHVQDTKFWAKLMLDMTRAVQHLHTHDVVHRDIALRNFLVSEDGRVLICDFGLSRRIARESSAYYTAKSDDPLPLRWMAPESLLSHKFTRASDVWSLGVTMWEILNRGQRKPYYDVEISNQIVYGVVSGTMVLPLDEGPLSYIASQCMCHNDVDRPSLEWICEQLELHVNDNVA